MNILHAAIPVVAGRAQPQPLLHLRIPQLGNVGHLDAPLDEIALQLITQDDVSRISHLIRIDPDQARFDPVVKARQVRRRERRLLAEMGADARSNERQERRVVAKLHLAKQALTLVDGHGARLTRRLAQPLARQPLLVAGVAGLVDDAHQARDKLLFVVARGHAHIGGHPAAKRMGADIEAALVEVKADERHHLEPERLLLLSREGAGGGEHRIAALALTDLCDEPR